MPLAEYASDHFQRGVPLYDEMLSRCVRWAEGRYKGWRAAKLPAGLWGRERVDTLAWGGDDDGGGGGDIGGGGSGGAGGAGANGSGGGGGGKEA